jgi:hypothetical protein
VGPASTDVPAFPIQLASARFAFPPLYLIALLNPSFEANTPQTHVEIRRRQQNLLPAALESSPSLRMDQHYNPRTVEEVFRDFKGRRAGIIRALTTGRLLIHSKVAELFWAPSTEMFSFEFYAVRCVFLRPVYGSMTCFSCLLLQMRRISTSNATPVSEFALLTVVLFPVPLFIFLSSLSLSNLYCSTLLFFLNAMHF